MTNSTIDIAALITALQDNKPDHSDDKLVTFPKKEGVAVKPAETRIGLPEGITAEKAAKILTEHSQAMKEEVRVIRKFTGRLEDVQVAVNRICLRTWGTSGRGQMKYDFFGGAHPPVTDSVTVGLDYRGYPITETVAVSTFTLAPLEAELEYGTWTHEEFGILGMVSVVSKKGNEKSVQQFLDTVEETIRTDSIYKGAVLNFKRRRNASGDAPYELAHRKVTVDSGIVYNRFTENRLEDKLFGRIRYADAIGSIKEGRKNTFRTLLYGPYGTGKTECTVAASVTATEQGWTTIFFSPGEHDNVTDLAAAYNTAELYAPSLLVVEDIDRYYEHGDSVNGHSHITNILDGPMTKGSKVSVLMTTNELSKIPSSATRKGRMDGMIEIGALDREATERMFKLLLADELADDVNFDEIYAVVEGTGPSFIRATFEDARDNSIISNKGEVGHKLTTRDLVEAATQSLEQSRQHESTRTPTKEELFYKNFTEVAKVIGGNDNSEEIENISSIVKKMKERFEL